MSTPISDTTLCTTPIITTPILTPSILHLGACKNISHLGLSMQLSVLASISCLGFDPAVQWDDRHEDSSNWLGLGANDPSRPGLVRSIWWRGGRGGSVGGREAGEMREEQVMKGWDERYEGSQA